MFKFEKLSVWQKSIVFADLVHSATRTFPADERFGLTNQLRRAATSVASNIAEGSARPDPDFKRFLGYASGSPYEVVTQSHVARNQGLLPTEQFARIYADAEEISRMLSGLRDSLDGPDGASG
ncbi:MAG TPA: four helix bundle protein [Lacunisphaera sp.]|nr:four helix bundle protein [Lacunisphaera sp.]